MFSTENCFGPEFYIVQFQCEMFYFCIFAEDRTDLLNIAQGLPLRKSKALIKNTVLTLKCNLLIHSFCIHPAPLISLLAPLLLIKQTSLVNS